MAFFRRVAATSAVALLASCWLASQGLNTVAIDQALGRTGQRNGSVYRVSFPRSDLHVTLDGVTLRPGLALVSWAAFAPSGSHAVVTGDLCLLPREVNPVMARLRQGGYEISALHNHLLFESPHVMYMHYWAQGEAAALAQTLHAALALSQTPLGAPSASAAVPAPPWVKTVESALGRTGKWNAGVLAFGVPRAAGITMAGMEVPPSMGVAESMNFQQAAGARLATTGDFVLTASEVNPVISALEKHHIAVTA
ncbi:MAG: DUF1259 domain-containing protein, partial [Terriglobales bacterium]